MVLEETFESPLDSKEIKPDNPKGNEPWIFIGRTDEVPILWLPDVKSWLTGKEPDAGNDWRQEEKGMAEEWIRLDGITDLMHMSLSKPLEMVKDREAWCAVGYGVTKNQTCLSNWTTALWTFVVVSSHPTHKYLYVYWVSTSTSHSAKIH